MPEGQDIIPDSNFYIVVGKVAGAYGIKGWIKVVSYTRPPDNLINYEPWYLVQNDQYIHYQVVDIKRHGKSYIASLAGITDRDSAMMLSGCDIAIARSQLPVVEPGEYYYADLINMDVVNQTGKHLGKLVEIVETGANDVMVVVGDDRHLIPLVMGSQVTDIDTGQGIIRVDWEADYS